jgi:multidrug efflux system membrane fusion protein
VTAIGNVESYSSVSIKAQISGELLDAHFTEGDTVHKGQLLLTIDPRPYEATLAQAKADLARDKATAINNRVQADRNKKLLDAGIIPAQQAEVAVSTADASDAVVSADEAAIQTAQINVDYCKIYSPIDGRTGVLMLKPGNLVKAADVPILVINQVSPIFVNFTVPQEYLAEVRKYMSQGSLKVEATVPNDAAPPEKGTLTFVDNSVDTTTGTIHLRATFPNGDNKLWPGLYVSVLVTLAVQDNATIVPAHAVVPGQKGPIVYVVRENLTVEARSVTSSRTVGEDAVITGGLRIGEEIVTDGQSLLAPNAKVEIKSGP